MARTWAVTLLVSVILVVTGAPCSPGGRTAATRHQDETILVGWSRGSSTEVVGVWRRTAGWEDLLSLYERDAARVRSLVGASRTWTLFRIGEKPVHMKTGRLGVRDTAGGDKLLQVGVTTPSIADDYEGLAVSGSSQMRALPARRLPLEDPAAQQVVLQILRGRGLSTGKVTLTQNYAVDLDRDGRSDQLCAAEVEIPEDRDGQRHSGCMIIALFRGPSEQAAPTAVVVTERTMKRLSEPVSPLGVLSVRLLAATTSPRSRRCTIAFAVAARDYTGFELGTFARDGFKPALLLEHGT